MAVAMKRTILERFDVPESNYETVMVLLELAPGSKTGLHTHPGFDVAYVIEGDLTVITVGQPDQTFIPGQAWHIAPGAVHEEKAGSEPVRAIGAYIVEKGQPMVIPYD